MSLTSFFEFLGVQVQNNQHRAKKAGRGANVITQVRLGQSGVLVSYAEGRKTMVLIVPEEGEASVEEACRIREAGLSFDHSGETEQVSTWEVERATAASVVFFSHRNPSLPSSPPCSNAEVGFLQPIPLCSLSTRSSAQSEADKARTDPLRSGTTPRIPQRVNDHGHV